MNTSLDRITHEGNTVTVVLNARQASHYSSLTDTATRHFMDWQAVNWPRLRYKSSELIHVESHTNSCDDDGMFDFIVTYQLKG